MPLIFQPAAGGGMCEAAFDQCDTYHVVWPSIPVVDGANTIHLCRRGGFSNFITLSSRHPLPFPTPESPEFPSPFFALRSQLQSLLAPECSPSARHRSRHRGRRGGCPHHPHVGRLRPGWLVLHCLCGPLGMSNFGVGLVFLYIFMEC